MSKSWIASILHDVANSTRVNRNNAANIVWDNPEIFKDLFKMVFEIDKKESVKAAWVLEWICTHKDLDLLAPHLDYFTTNINKVHFDSAIRPVAKICEHLAKAYTGKKESIFKKLLTKNHREQIIETGFDWLITPQKIAVKAYTMQTLYLFGLEEDWILPELKHIIRTKIIHESKGCEARGRKILALIEKHQKATR